MHDASEVNLILTSHYEARSDNHDNLISICIIDTISEKRILVLSAA
jgi:hypothetical protein